MVYELFKPLHATALIGALLWLGSGLPIAASTVTFGNGENQFTMEFVDVGNPGNADDGTGYGGVSYAYEMGKFEVSRDMITKANAEASLGLTLQDMTRAGGNGSLRPATGISWNEAARFVNWLNTSQGFQAAYRFETAGPNDDLTLWSSGDAWQVDGENLFRHKRARYVLPSEDEWYKAAFYEGSTGTYYDYATASNSAPAPVASGMAMDTAVYAQNFATGPAEVTSAGGFSAYGTMAQSGNVREWAESSFLNENRVPAEFRVVRNGNWNAVDPIEVRSSKRTPIFPSLGTINIGFRVAVIPEADLATSPEITVSGRGVNINNGDNTPTVFEYTDFGPTVIGNSPLLHEYLITNVGDQDLSLSGTPLVQLSGGSAFSVSVQPASATVVAGHGRQTFTIAFDPTTSGVQTAVVSISNNDSDENPFTFTIQGDTQTAMELFNDAVDLAELAGNDALPDAEPYGDGVSNLLKYAFNMNLTGPDSSSMPIGGTGGLPSGRIVEKAGLPYWRVEFVRRKGSGLIYDPVKSSDLSQNSFVSFSAVGIPESIDLLWERVIYDEPVALGKDARCFSRVEVTLP